MDIATIFGGKAQVSNLYTKALQLVKDKEVQSTTFAFDTLLSYYSTCPGLTDTDFVHILYHSNLSFRTAFIQIFPTSTQWPTDDLIDKSYKKFLVCKGIKTTDVVTLSDIQSINETINTLYYTYYSHNFMTTTLVQNNFGSDVFWNGSVDDSDFDILSDIHQLGQIFFDTFTQSPEILFYRLPTVSSASVSAGVASTPSSSSTMSTLGSDLSSSSSSSSSW